MNTQPVISIRSQNNLQRVAFSLIRLVAFSMIHLLLLCGILVGIGSVEAKDPPVDQFESAIKTFERKDSTSPPPQHGTVFIGSSTFTKWTDLEHEFHEFKAINRGFGGSTIPEINNYIDRIVTRYKPDRIVFYAGTNDIAEGHTGKTVSEDFKTFVDKVRATLPETEIFFISMSVPPSREQWTEQYETGNKLIKSYTEHTAHLHYIDITPVMHDQNGGLRRDYFLLDRLHMKPSGYQAWTPIIRQALLSGK